MKKILSLQKCFNLDEMIFHPEIYYLGEWGINLTFYNESEDLLIKNQINDRYSKFIHDNYILPMRELLDTKSAVVSNPLIVSKIDDKSEKRGLFFDFDTFLLSILRTSLLMEREELASLSSKLSELETNEKKVIYVSYFLSEQCKKYKDLLINGTQSQYYEKAREMYIFFNDNYKNSKFNFEQFYEKYSKDTKNIKKRLLNIVPFFEKEINCKQFIECFDYDKLSLIIAYSLLVNAIYSKEQTGTIGNTLNYVYYYVQAVEKLRKNRKNYNKSIEVFDEENDSVKIITTNDVIEKFYEIKKDYDDIPFSQLSTEELDAILKSFGYDNVDLSTKEGYDIVSGIIKKLREDKLLAADWVFIPNEELNILPKKRKQHGTGDDALYEKKVKYVNRCKEFLDSTKYLYKIYGRNIFTGYIGYIYSSGYVIFEKFDLGKTTARHATYIMEYKQFLQNSKYNKRDLISKIKSGEVTGVYREFHKSDDFEMWKSNIMKYINGFEYTKEVIDYIDMVLASSTITKDDTKVLKK